MLIFGPIGIELIGFNVRPDWFDICPLGFHRFGCSDSSSVRFGYSGIGYGHRHQRYYCREAIDSHGFHLTNICASKPMALLQSIGTRLFPQQFSLAAKPPSLVLHSDDYSVCFLRGSLLNLQRRRKKGICRHISNRFSVDGENDESISFEEAVLLFNNRRFYDCHDHLEMLWHDAQDPSRTLIHGLLQCAVGLHHLFNRNHKGAMMELGEGICKLRKMNFKTGPFHQFEREISAVLDFIYQTQMELAACGEDICVTMDRSERSYQLLGGYGAGQHLYELESSSDEVVYIVFCPPWINEADLPQRVKLPTLSATNHHLMTFDDE